MFCCVYHRHGAARPNQRPFAVMPVPIAMRFDSRWVRLVEPAGAKDLVVAADLSSSLCRLGRIPAGSKQGQAEYRSGNCLGFRTPLIG